jgi:putative Mn2+ efflux pump MntP
MTNEITIMLIINSLLFGVGLAMDAFSVSVANGLSEPNMKPGKMSIVAGCYAFFQFAMPMIGWVMVHTIIAIFGGLRRAIPWVGFILLLFIGGKMIIETLADIKKEKALKAKGITPVEEEEKPVLGFGLLVVQGIATSIDALSVGLTVADYHVTTALVSSIIIAVVTFILCILGLKLGKFVGKGLGKYACIVGGGVLIGIGIEILIKGLFF